MAETTEYLARLASLRDECCAGNQELKNVLDSLDEEYARKCAETGDLEKLKDTDAKKFMELVASQRDFNSRWGAEIAGATERFDTKIETIFEDENDQRKGAIEGFSKRVGKLISPGIIANHMVRIVSKETTERYVSDEMLSDDNLRSMYKDEFRKQLLTTGRQISLEDFVKNMKSDRIVHGLTRGYTGRSDMMLVVCDLGTFAHEMGHVVQNAGGEKIASRETEIGELLMTNKKFFGNYSMTTMGTNYTEILSTGLENLVESPVDFYVQSPMHFLFTVAILQNG